MFAGASKSQLSDCRLLPANFLIHIAKKSVCEKCYSFSSGFFLSLRTAPLLANILGGQACGKWEKKNLSSLEIWSGPPCESSPLETSTSSKTPPEWAEIGRLCPQGSLKTGQSGSLQNRPMVKARDIDVDRSACRLCRHEQCLERRKETTSHRTGKARMVFTKDRARNRCTA